MIKYGVATQEERDIANILKSNLISQQQLQQQQFAFEDQGHSGRYNSSFFITDNRSYQYKREKIFKLKDEEGMPGLYQQPNEGQQKAMDFIKTHLLIQRTDHYWQLFNENELRKIKPKYSWNTTIGNEFWTENRRI